MSAHPAAPRSTFVGLFLVTLATIMYEIALTRIFSVTMWYHFAFVAISVAMFGMTVGALVVYLRPAPFAPERATRAMGASALAFAGAIVGSFLTHLVVPFSLEASIVGVYSVVLTYVVIAAPFVCSGVCVCVALTRFPAQLGRLYAVDLAGAALGCALVIVVIDGTDGPTTVVAAAALAAMGAACLLRPADGVPLRAAALLTVTGLCAFVAINSVLAIQQNPLVRVRWVKGAAEPTPLYEKWNSFSRITVQGDARRPTPPRGWGLSAAYPRDRGVRQLNLLMDSAAGTVLTRYTGRPEEIEHLRWDIVNLPHHLRRDASVLVVGAGGGRDVLSALAFGQRSVVAVEINEAILELVNVHLGGFTGHLDWLPHVRFVNDEARSFVARQRERFDIVQISLIDTWAATGAGAFVLSEHSLYTTEAWRLFLDRLTPRGVLAVSRFYVDARPDEMLRLTALAAAGLRARGITEARPHVMILRHLERGADGRPAPFGAATLVVSPTPFSAADIDAVEALARQMAFDVVLTPRAAIDATFAALVSGRDLAGLHASFPVDITAPTDDRPFFFHTVRLADALRPGSSSPATGGGTINTSAVQVLAVLLLTVLGLTALCIVVPLVLTTERGALAGSLPLFVFFAGIGLGFMLVEISQMQRLIIFLGHPTYGLSVVLFAMLAAGGLGSLLTSWLPAGGWRAGAPLVALLGVLAVFGAVTPWVVQAFDGATTPVRIAVAAGILFPLGVPMGMAFPLGMRLAAARSGALTPWLWGVNGATSVCASVLAVAIALEAGIAAAFWAGTACYAAAGLAFVAAARRRAPVPLGAAERLAPASPGA